MSRQILSCVVPKRGRKKEVNSFFLPLVGVYQLESIGYCGLCYRIFLFFELAHIQVVIEALSCKQFIMFAAFNDLAVPEDQNHIRVADRR